MTRIAGSCVASEQRSEIGLNDPVVNRYGKILSSPLVAFQLRPIKQLVGNRII
jgi:hypothetical protein